MNYQKKNICRFLVFATSCFNNQGFCMDKEENKGKQLFYNNTQLKDTELVYLNDTYLMEDKSSVLEVGKDAKGPFVIFDRTIFYPQGGGQPSDTGIIQIDEQKYQVQHVVFSEGKVIHYLDNIEGIKEKSNVLMNVDLKRRLINAQAHTAGHLLDAVSRTVAPEIIGKKGYHFLEGPYVEFEGVLKLPPEIFISKVNDLLAEAIKSQPAVEVINADAELLKTLKLPTDFKVPEGKSCRFVQIHGFAPVPCGGTHIKNLSELKEVTVRKISSKKGLTKVSYRFC